MVSVDIMLGIALAVPGHHIPPIMSLGGLAARRTSSSAHRSPTSYKGAQLGAGLGSVERGATPVEQGLAAWPSRQATPIAVMPPDISVRAAVALTQP